MATLIQTEQELLELHNAIPKDLTNIICNYIPTIEFTWTNHQELFECDTLITWNGVLTYGSWQQAYFKVSFKNDIFLSVCNGGPIQNYITSDHTTVRYCLSILSGKPHESASAMRRVSIEEVESKWAFPDYNAAYYNNPGSHLQTWWIVKCDPQLLVDEIKFVINTITTSPCYNHKYFIHPYHNQLL